MLQLPGGRAHCPGSRNRNRYDRFEGKLLVAALIVTASVSSQTKPEQSRRVLDVEVHGRFNAVQTVLPHMREAGGGSVVHLGSAGDLRWPDMDGLSVAPKAANEALVNGFAREEGKYGIRANSVLISVIEAGMFLELRRQGVFNEEWKREVRRNLAIKRWSQPDEIAHAAIFLASDKARYVTGQQIAIAAGYGI